MKKSAILAIDQSQPFQVNEMFFSTTDGKGIITSGNDVFVRVSGYQRSELIGEPHNIIRHPHMPRVVFKLLWDYLLAGSPISAYVKNMSADGRYYWVVALATPIEGGFLSVRFKPTNAIFPIVSDLYQKLLAIEQGLAPDWRAGMVASGEALQNALLSLGFKDYSAFMNHFLHEELKSRDALLTAERLSIFDSSLIDKGQAIAKSDHIVSTYVAAIQLHGTLNHFFSQIDDYISLNQQLEKKSQFVLELTKGFRFISLNTHVRSSRLGAQGASLSVIADYMQESSTIINRSIGRLNQVIDYLSRALSGINFNIAGAKLQTEMIISFCAEKIRVGTSAGAEDEDLEHTIKRLQNALANTLASVQQDFLGLGDQLGLLDDSADDLAKAVTALQFVQIGGEVESCNLVDERGFKTIFSEVKNQLDRAKSELKDLGRIMELLKRLSGNRFELNSMVKEYESATVVQSSL